MAAPLELAACAAALDPERRLAELARSGAPLRRVVAALAGRLVARQAWSRLGYARLGDYARERLGRSGRSLQELARVDRALVGLPKLEAALVSGRLPWSKVRLLARFASREDEAGWIARAEGTSVRALEKRCRAVARGAAEADALARDEDGREASPGQWVRVGATLGLALRWRAVVRVAEQVAGEPVTPAGALEMVTAEALSARPTGVDAEALSALPPGVDAEALSALPPGVAAEADDEPVRRPRPLEDVGVEDVEAAEPPPPGAASEPDPERAELPRFLLPLVQGLANADAFELDARLRRAVRLEQRLDAQVAPLLRQVTASEYAWRQRYQTLAAYARDRLGMSPRKARALLQVERVASVCAELRTAYRDGQLSWLQAKLLAPLLRIDADGAWRPAWVAFAGRVTLRRLEQAVERALWLRQIGDDGWNDVEAVDGGLPGGAAGAADPEADPEADRERQMCARPRDPGGDVPIRIFAPAEVARLFRAALCRVRLAIERHRGRLASEAEAFDVMLDHALASWQVDDRRLRRQLRSRHAIFERDGWRCTVPGCTSRRSLQAHHLVFRSAGGGDEPDNQTTLCAFHHQRGVHGGTLRIAGSAPDALWFELGTREGHPPLARYRSGDRVA